MSNLHQLVLSRFVSENSHYSKWESFNKQSQKKILIKRMSREFLHGSDILSLKEFNKLLFLSHHPGFYLAKEIVWSPSTGSLLFVYPECLPSLRNLLTGRVKPLSPLLIKVYSWQILHLLEVLHRKGLFYGNLKPSNVLISPEYDVYTGIKLQDFHSITYQEEDAGGLFSLVGKPTDIFEDTNCLKHYMKSASFDLFCLYCVVFEMVTFAPLFKAAEIQEIITGSDESCIVDQLMEKARSLLETACAAKYGDSSAYPDFNPEGLLDFLSSLMVSHSPFQFVQRRSNSSYTQDEALSVIEAAIAHPYFDEFRGVEKPDFFDPFFSPVSSNVSIFTVSPEGQLATLQRHEDIDKLTSTSVVGKSAKDSKLVVKMHEFASNLRSIFSHTAGEWMDKIKSNSGPHKEYDHDDPLSLIDSIDDEGNTLDIELVFCEELQPKGKEELVSVPLSIKLPLSQRSFFLPSKTEKLQFFSNGMGELVVEPQQAMSSKESQAEKEPNNTDSWGSGSKRSLASEYANGRKQNAFVRSQSNKNTEKPSIQIPGETRVGRRGAEETGKSRSDLQLRNSRERAKPVKRGLRMKLPRSPFALDDFLRIQFLRNLEYQVHRKCRLASVPQTVKNPKEVPSNENAGDLETMEDSTMSTHSAENVINELSSVTSNHEFGSERSVNAIDMDSKVILLSSNDSVLSSAHTIHSTSSNNHYLSNEQKSENCKTIRDEIESLDRQLSHLREGMERVRRFDNEVVIRATNTKAIGPSVAPPTRQPPPVPSLDKESKITSFGNVTPLVRNDPSRDINNNNPWIRGSDSRVSNASKQGEESETYYDSIDSKQSYHIGPRRYSYPLEKKTMAQGYLNYKHVQQQRVGHTMTSNGSVKNKGLVHLSNQSNSVSQLTSVENEAHGSDAHNLNVTGRKYQIQVPTRPLAKELPELVPLQERRIPLLYSETILPQRRNSFVCIPSQTSQTSLSVFSLNSRSSAAETAPRSSPFLPYNTREMDKSIMDGKSQQSLKLPLLDSKRPSPTELRADKCTSGPGRGGIENYAEVHSYLNVSGYNLSSQGEDMFRQSLHYQPQASTLDDAKKRLNAALYNPVALSSNERNFDVNSGYSNPELRPSLPEAHKEYTSYNYKQTPLNMRGRESNYNTRFDLDTRLRKMRHSGTVGVAKQDAVRPRLDVKLAANLSSTSTLTGLSTSSRMSIQSFLGAPNDSNAGLTNHIETAGTAATNRTLTMYVALTGDVGATVEGAPIKTSLLTEQQGDGQSKTTYGYSINSVDPNLHQTEKSLWTRQTSSRSNPRPIETSANEAVSIIRNGSTSSRNVQLPKTSQDSVPLSTISSFRKLNYRVDAPAAMDKAGIDPAPRAAEGSHCAESDRSIKTSM